MSGHRQENGPQGRCELLVSFYQSKGGVLGTTCSDNSVFHLFLQLKISRVPQKGSRPCLDSTLEPQVTSASRTCCLPRTGRSLQVVPDWPHPAHLPSRSSLLTLGFSALWLWSSSDSSLPRKVYLEKPSELFSPPESWLLLPSSSPPIQRGSNKTSLEGHFW